MAVLNEADFNQLLQTRFGNSEDENDISFLEDVTDTVNSLRENQDSGGYKQKYEDLQKKYRDRFFSSKSDPEPDPEPEQDVNRISFESLFTSK